MSVSQYFSADYAEARRKFLGAAQAAGARVEHHENPSRGPEGEALFADTAWLGPEAARNVLVTISGTHGAEGFCGSGVQVGWLETGLHADLPADTALLQIHAINPHGFAWIRRVTEDNVDLNRNFVDHAGPHPDNPGYRDLAEVLCPAEWNDSVIAETEAQLAAYGEREGGHALQMAISGGQYSHPDGIFYGGRQDTWSRRTLLDILGRLAAGAEQVAIIDYHTGLGPRGYGERICAHLPDSGALKRAEQWYDGDMTCPSLGTSSACELNGVNLQGMERALSGTAVTGIALEYGTLPTPQVRRALRADNWLHVHGDPGSPKGRAIKAEIREAFYQDADDWKQMIWDRAVETQRLALAGMAGS